ncbi:MAG: PEP-CTERM sorting domain-containing protein [Deltaproteobacteria bacterium]|nr:PEP-CTERM sorting domain-containing protein [Deltaproteobacteria bacterium]
MKKLILGLTVAAVMLISTTASAITVDGNFSLAEWNGYYANDDGVGPGGYVGPAYGGQSFDAEYLGLYLDNSGKLYFGLQTGFNLASGVTTGGYHYNPGDLALEVNGDGVYDYAIRFSISGGVPTYTLYQVSTWQNVMYSQFGISDPFKYATGSSVPTTFTGAYGTGVFANNSDGGTSYVLEGSLDLSSLSLYNGGNLTLHWTMECGNDYINKTIPEPGTIFLLGSGLVGCGALGFIRRKRKA